MEKTWRRLGAAGEIPAFWRIARNGAGLRERWLLRIKKPGGHNEERLCAEAKVRCRSFILSTCYSLRGHPGTGENLVFWRGGVNGSEEINLPFGGRKNNSVDVTLAAIAAAVQAAPAFGRMLDHMAL